MLIGLSVVYVNSSIDYKLATVVPANLSYTTCGLVFSIFNSRLPQRSQ